MTENRAIKITIEDALHCEKFIYGEELCEEAEIWDKYRSIGTVEECRAAVEKAYAYLSGSISNGIFTEVICKKCRSRREGAKNK